MGWHFPGIMASLFLHWIFTDQLNKKTHNNQETILFLSIFAGYLDTRFESTWALSLNIFHSMTFSLREQRHTTDRCCPEGPKLRKHLRAGFCKQHGQISLGADVLAVPTGLETGMVGVGGVCMFVHLGGTPHWLSVGVCSTDACHSAAGLFLPQLYL